MHRFLKFSLAFLFSLAIFGLGTGVGYALTTYLNQQTQPDDLEQENFSLFWEVWNIVDDKFYNRPTLSTATTYGAIKGALATLEDPYTVFIEPKPRALEKARLDGEFGGIGAYVLRGEAGEVILEPMLDSPAEKAGLLKGDILIQVDDTALLPEMTTDEIVLLIRGEVGTEVVLTLEREDETEPLALAVTRAIIETPSVQWRILDEDASIGYIQISLFSNRTFKELNRAFTELAEQGAEKYIIDLRGNGGGLLEAALDVTSKFVVGDQVILNEDRRGQEPKIYQARDVEKVLDIDLVVLIDGGTASASEILAGALQDYDRATLIGERTFGKGSVQLVYDLSDESSLHVTVAKWFTPNDNSIDGVGLNPDIEVLFSEDDHATGNDPQFKRAIEFLQTQ